MADSASKPNADWGNQTGIETPRPLDAQKLDPKIIEEGVGKLLNELPTDLPYQDAAKAVAASIQETPGGREAFEKELKDVVKDTLQGGGFTDDRLKGVKFIDTVAADLGPLPTPKVEGAQPAKLPARP